VTALLPPRAEFGVISDVDDTVLVSEVRNLVRMARLTFLNNARTRLPFPGVAQFYRALQRCAGATGTDATATTATCYNPIFYVSSSPWNLYDLLVDFMALNDIPPGPLFLRNYGIDAPMPETRGHHGHKLARIEELFAVYPELPFVLIGDSSQQDPEIYAEVVRRYGDRVRAIYIRDVVARSRRDTQVVRLGEETATHGVPMLLVPDTAAAEAHARSLGLIAG
jgi:phosphatidate phosphatase APP1